MEYRGIVDISEELFHEVLEHDRKQWVLVCFWSTELYHCQLMEPFLEQVAELCVNYVIVTRLIAADNPTLSIRLQVEFLPTFLIFKDGLLIERVVTANPLLLARTLSRAMETIQ